MRVGLLGAGRIGVFHATVLAEDHRVEEVVVGDVDAKRAAALAERIGGVREHRGGNRFGAGRRDDRRYDIGPFFREEAGCLETVTKWRAWTPHAELRYAGKILIFAGVSFIVPEVGLEPTRGCPHRILSPARLPFRHSGAENRGALYQRTKCAPGATRGLLTNAYAPTHNSVEGSPHETYGTWAEGSGILGRILGPKFRVSWQWVRTKEVGWEGCVR